MANDGWKKMNSEGGDAPAWKPENTGDEVQGVYIDVKDVTTKFGPSKVYTLQKEDGSFVAVFGKAPIDREMTKLSLGDEVKIVFLGMQMSEKTGRSFKNFDVFARKAEAKSATPKPETPTEDDVDPDEIPF